MITPPAVDQPSHIDLALMRFPHQQWIPAPAAAAHVENVGLPREILRLVIRTGKRRGVLRIKRVPDHVGFYVMRVSKMHPDEVTATA
ncbi:hypothetical protein [Streptomyces sp. NPDC001068]|uniref:hypothetical protein n=1 Tax=Streptomyces sp. NPDC001068 TaxID=3364544 RepID=UPI003676FF82